MPRDRVLRISRAEAALGVGLRALFSSASESSRIQLAFLETMPFERYNLGRAEAEAEEIRNKFEKTGNYKEAERQVEQGHARKTLTERSTDLILKRYGGAEGEIKAFHNIEHTNGVRRRAEAILETVKQKAPEAVTDGELALVDIIAGLHDADIETLASAAFKHPVFDRDPDGKKRLGPDGKPLVKGTVELTHLRRPLAVNEENSIKLLKEWLDEVNKERQEVGVKEVFTETDISTAEKAIRATIPGFDPETMTVVPLTEVPEKYLSPEAKKTKEALGLKTLESPLEIALSLADLGEAAMDPEEFKTAGINNFIEDHSGWIEKIAAVKAGKETLTATQQDDYAWILKGFLEIQPGFAAGRLKNSQKLIERLPEAARPALRELMSKTEESVEAAQATFDEVKGMNLDQLLLRFPLLRNKIQEAADRLLLDGAKEKIKGLDEGNNVEKKAV